jgi:hypothetical protein
LSKSKVPFEYRDVLFTMICSDMREDTKKSGRGWRTPRWDGMEWTVYGIRVVPVFADFAVYLKIDGWSGAA